MDRLLYRRQFLLTRKWLPGLDGWKRLDLGRYCLHIHPDLQVSVAYNSAKSLTLLGYLYDTENVQLNNQEILERILAVTKDFRTLTLSLKRYPGR